MMLGVVMEDPMLREDSQGIPADVGIASPKQTILNFFKPSMKPSSDLKPKDLLGYFTKTSPSVLSEVKVPPTVELPCDQQKTSKRKRSTDLETSVDGFKLSLKKKLKSGQNKKPIDYTEESKDSESEKKSDDVCKSVKTPISNSGDGVEIPVEGKKIKEMCFKDFINNVCTVDDATEELCEINNVLEVGDGGSLHDSRKVDEVSDDEVLEEVQVNISDDEKSNLNIQSCASDNERKVGTDTEGREEGSNGEEDVQEMSFDEYMVSLHNPNDSKLEQKDCEVKQEEEVDKNQINITNFFCKVNKNTEKKTDDDSAKEVTICVDIHPEPKQSSPELIKKNKVISPENILKTRNTKTDNEIIFLSTEIIELDSEEKGNKPTKSAKKDKTQVKTSSAKNTTKAEMTNNSATKGKARRSLNLKNSTSEPENVGSSDICILNSSDSEKDVCSNSGEKSKSDFLKSSESVVLSKTTQSTLNFGTKSDSRNKKKASCTRLQNSGKSKKELPKPILESTPVKGSKSKRPKKLKATAVDGCLTSEKELSGEESTGGAGKKKKKQKYEVTFLDADDKKRTPIRMKLRRCNTSREVSDTDFTPQSERCRKPATGKPQNAKVSAAKKLLVKAKSSKVKASGKLASSVHDKKSPRLQEAKQQKADSSKSVKNKGSSKVLSKNKNAKSSKIGQKNSDKKQLNISDDDVVVIDDISQPKTKARGDAARKTPIKTKTRDKNTQKTPKKAVKKPPENVKLASIFSQKGGAKPQIERKNLDPEKEKVRQAFLMSGVPDQLKRQSSNVPITVQADYPPIPVINHVQQKRRPSTGLDIWNLSPVDLPVVKTPLGSVNIEKMHPASGLLIDQNESGLKFEVFEKPPLIEPPVCEQLLEEIGVRGSVYPVQAMYKTLTHKKRQAENDNESLSSFFSLLTGIPSKKNEAQTKPVLGDKTESTQKKKGGRRSLRKRKSLTDGKAAGNDIEVHPDEHHDKDKQETNKPTCPEAPGLLWTDKYQPNYADEILGNEGNIKQLRTWLLEWKHRFNKEAKKIKRMMMKESKNKKNKDRGDWLMEDSDFDYDSTDSEEEEEDTLCNTVLLTGPQGIGKTASVYALSNELGFKVFEVNASSCRSGKKILSQLQEATQSLRVAQNKNPTANPGLESPMPKDKCNKPEEKKLPTAFANLFKKNNTNTCLKEVASQPKSSITAGDKRGKKRKRDEKADELSDKKRKLKAVEDQCRLLALDEDSSSSNKGLNLTSTSLILFDEVDVVFEEDKGFWTAVQSFMASTKIPIVLTTSDSSFPSNFEGRYEQYSFKKPSLVQITCHLQLICLIEHVRINSREIADLVRMYGGDIRRCLLALQYWVVSGGGISRTQKSICKSQTAVIEVDDNTCSQQSLGDNTIGSDNCLSVTPPEPGDADSIQVLKSGRRRARVLVDDDSSSSMAVLAPSMPTQPVNHPTGDTPLLHTLVLDSLIGSTNYVRQPLMECLQSNISKRQVSSGVFDACRTFSEIKKHIPYNYYISLLPFTKNISDGSWKKNSLISKPEKKRQRIKNDLYDSEESNEGQLNSIDETKPILDSESSSIVLHKSPDVACTAKGKRMLMKSITEFSDFYDTMSLIDMSNSVIFHQCVDNVSVERGYMKDSMSDEKVSRDVDNWWVHSTQKHLSSELEVRALHKLCCEVGCDVDILDDPSYNDNCILPVDSGIEERGLTRDDPQRFISCRPALLRAQKNVMNSLPLCSRPSVSSVSLDCMPMLRSVVRAEQSRRESKIKRRFHHYFDNIGLPLKRSTMEVLLSTFHAS